jgi:protein-tyrosine phosphatase
MKNLFLSVPLTEVQSNLYMGSIKDAFDLKLLREHNITHILNISKEVPNFFPDAFEYKWIQISDKLDVPISKFFEDSNLFILRGLEKGSVLVHCACGISRSATIMLAFLVRHRDFEPMEALKFLRKKRPIVKPNAGFIQQLKRYYDDNFLSLSEAMEDATYEGKNVASRSFLESGTLEALNKISLVSEAKKDSKEVFFSDETLKFDTENLKNSQINLREPQKSALRSSCMTECSEKIDVGRKASFEI